MEKEFEKPGAVCTSFLAPSTKFWCTLINTVCDFTLLDKNASTAVPVMANSSGSPSSAPFAWNGYNVVFVRCHEILTLDEGDKPTFHEDPLMSLIGAPMTVFATLDDFTIASFSMCASTAPWSLPSCSFQRRYFIVPQSL
jgi:hypothetical protein